MSPSGKILRHEAFDSYGDALWWTATIITTLGSQYWPATAAGRDTAAKPSEPT
jgi:hypothetical protein